MDPEIQAGTTVQFRWQIMQYDPLGPQGAVKPLPVNGLTVALVFLGPYAAGQPQTRLTRSASYLTDGSDGWVTYTAAQTDLAATGGWQAQLTPNGGGQNYPTTIYAFRVKPNL